MAKQGKIWVTPTMGFKVPAGIVDKDKEVWLEPGVPKLLPIAYAEHLVVEGRAAKGKGKAEPEAEIKPTGPTPEALAQARTNVEVAQAKVDELADREDAVADKETAAAALKQAQETLARLEAAAA